MPLSERTAPQGAVLFTSQIEHQVKSVMHCGLFAMSSAEEPEWLTRVRANDLQLTALILGWKRIGDDGARNLVVVLGANNTLMSINLGANNIGDDGARSLAAALERNTTLTSIELGSNNIGVRGQHALVSALEASNFTLCELGGVEGVDHLLERNKLIARNRKLKVRRYSDWRCLLFAVCLFVGVSAALRAVSCCCRYAAGLEAIPPCGLLAGTRLFGAVLFLLFIHISPTSRMLCA
jgi:hypothetical protein